MKRGSPTVIAALLGLISLASFPIPASAQQPQAMCRETLEAWVRDRSLNARWNSDRTAVIMVRGGVEYICTCPDQNRPPVCKPVVSAAKDKGKASPSQPRPASPSSRPSRASAPSDFENEKQELIRELKASGFLEPGFESGRAALLASVGDRLPAVRAEVEAAAGELAAGAPATKNGILQAIQGGIDAQGADAAAIARTLKVKAGKVPPLGKRFDNLRVGDVLLCRQPDDMGSLGFYTSGWIIIADKAVTGSSRARASHTFMLVRDVRGVKLFLDNMPGQGTRIKTEAQVTAEYANVGMDVARPLSRFDADLLWAAARQYGIKSQKEFAARAGNPIDTTDYGVWGDGEKVCSETMRWALVKAGLFIPETRSILKNFVGDVNYGPSDFYVDTDHFLVMPLELLPRRDAK
ncbi:MAG: hypothetical protein ABFD52_08405 [Acidobacteriota bacterium]